MKAIRAVYIILLYILVQQNVFSLNKHQTVQMAPAKQDSLLQAGIRLYSEGRYAEATMTLLDSQPDSSSLKAMFYLGMSYASLNDFQNAKKYFQSVVERDSTNVTYQFTYARFLVQAGALAEGRQHYETAFALDTMYIPALFQLGLLYNEPRSYDHAAEMFQRIIKINPKDFLSYYYLGNALVLLGKQDSARTCLKNSIELNPNFVPSIAVLASLYYTAKDYAKASELYQNALSQRPANADYAYKVGLCYRKLDDYPRAIAFFKRATENDSLTATYYANLGHAYFHQALLDSSVSAYEKAIVLDSQNALYFTNLALVYQQQDSVKASAQSFHNAIRTYHPEEIAATYYQLATMYFGKKHYKEAIAAYQKVLEFDPHSIEAQLFLGLALEQVNDVFTAMKSFQKYLALTSDDTTKRLMQQIVKDKLQELQKKK